MTITLAIVATVLQYTMSLLIMFQRLSRATLFFSRRAFAATAPATAQTEGGQLRLTFASPSKAFFTNSIVKQVDVPTMAGYVGVLANHVPTIGVLKPGVVQVYEEDGNVSKLFVSSGTLSVNIDGSVQVLAEEALKIEDIDESLAQKELEAGNLKASQATNEVERAEGEIQAEVAQALIKAVSGHL